MATSELRLPPDPSPASDVPKRQDFIALTSIVGSSVLFVGGMVYTFVDNAIHGAGYVVSTIGLAVTASAIVGTLWWGSGLKLVMGRRAGTLAPERP